MDDILNTDLFNGLLGAVRRGARIYCVTRSVDISAALNRRRDRALLGGRGFADRATLAPSR